MEKDFLEEVSELYLNHGAKNLTMDFIAKHFGISKKTLYQHYENKEILLHDVLQKHLKTIISTIEQRESCSNCPIESMLHHESCIQEMMDSRRDIFWQQIQQYYPKVAAEHYEEIYKFVADLFVKNIHKGRAMKIYREDFNEKTYLRMLLALMATYEVHPLITQKLTSLSRKEYSDEVIRMYLHSIVTEKGREILTNKIKINE